MENITVFLDRDGVINEEVGYITDPNKIKLIEGSKEALIKLNENDINIIVITNQSGIGRKIISQQVYNLTERKLRELIYPAILTDTLYCPHVSYGGCICRKPSSYLVFKSIEYNSNRKILLTDSFFIGDKITDIDCALNSKVIPILVLTGYGINTLIEIGKDDRYKNVLIFKNFKNAAEFIISLKNIK